MIACIAETLLSESWLRDVLRAFTIAIQDRLFYLIMERAKFLTCREGHNSKKGWKLLFYRNWLQAPLENVLQIVKIVLG